jgi:hypothetical protein
MPDIEENNQIQLPAAEIVNLLSAIQLASTRGAFSPEVFVGIGTAYERVFSFLADMGVLKNNNAQ